MHTLRRLAVIGSALAVLSAGAAPLLSSAADHLDAPALGGTVVAGQFAPHTEHGDRDINDVYVFKAPDRADRTAIAVTVNPAINLFGGNFGPNVRYVVNIDTDGDNVQDVAYVARFTGEGRSNNQFYLVTKYTGMQARTLSHGTFVAIGSTNSRFPAFSWGGEKVWAGVRSDPFFFDLTGFIGTTTTLKGGPTVGTDGLCDAQPTDFFAGLNTNAIVMTIPDWKLPDRIGVWATTSYWDGGWKAGDQMGRPAINTVFNGTPADKDLFNQTPPSLQTTASGGKFVTNMTSTLKFLSGFDPSGGAYTDAQAAALAGVLLPDVLPYDRNGTLPAPLNGRALADDVIDVELRVSTGGDPLGLFGRDADGAVNGDCVGPHSDYLSTFPYLGKPH